MTPSSSKASRKVAPLVLMERKTQLIDIISFMRSNTVITRRLVDELRSVRVYIV